jgi:hypothetical protein
MARDPQYGIPLSADEITTQDPSAVLYGVTSANKFIPIKISSDGTLASGAVSVTGSANSYYKDHTVTALTSSFVLQSFGFTSQSLLIANDEAIAGGYIEYSFNGTNIHGKLLPGETRSMDFRSQIGIYLKGQSGGEKYRLEVY